MSRSRNGRSAGLAREYDGEDLLHQPWHILRPLGASSVSGTALFLLVHCVPVARCAYATGQEPSFWSAYRAFMGAFWMTAPMAWLYAIPYERFLDPVGAVKANLWTLAIVAAWRVLLMSRVVGVLYGIGAVSSFFLVMCFADVVAFGVATLVPVPVFDVMGGLRHSARDALVSSSSVLVAVLSAITAPVWFIGMLVVLARSKPRWPLRPEAERERSPRGALLAACVAVLAFAALLPFTQPEQVRRHEAERLLRTGRVAEAFAVMSAHDAGDYPPHWDPPPRLGYLERTPSIDEITSAMEHQWPAAWVADTYLHKVRQGLRREIFPWTSLNDWGGFARDPTFYPRLESPTQVERGARFLAAHDPSITDDDRAALLTIAGFASASTLLGARPNIVVILCDDLGYADLACYGHPLIQTPNLDALAASGVRFTNFYSPAPVCSPSRVGLLTGRSPNRAGVYDWIPPARDERPDARDLVHMREHETTIAHLLRDVGYATCMAGKWHCNSSFNSPAQPQPGDVGFEHWFATQNNAEPSHADPRNFVRNGDAVGKIEGYSCQLVVDETDRWLTTQLREHPQQPFVAYVAFHEPHEPVASPPELVALYERVARNRREAEYFANVHNVDLAIGRLVARLEELGASENTLVVFTSDNGPETLERYRGAEHSYGNAAPLRGMKLWTTEGGVRVPGIVSWPAHVEAGRVSDEVVSSLDLLRTACAVAGVRLPEHTLDGTSALPAFVGKALDRPRPLLWVYYNAINERRVAMRDGEWKMLARLEGLGPLQNVHEGNRDAVVGAALGDFQLFRVTEDMGESQDLLASEPEVAARLERRMRSAYAELVRSSFVWTRRE